MDVKKTPSLQKLQEPTTRYSKALVLADLHRVLATQSVERIWPMYTYLYDNNMLDLLTKHNYYQLFTFTTRARATQTNYYRLLALVDDMKEHGVPLRLTEYNSLIHWIGGRTVPVIKPHHLKEAIDLFEEMQKPETFNKNGESIQKDPIQPSVETFNTLIAIASRLFDLRTSQKLYRDMISRGLRPDVFTYSTLISLVGKMGDVRGIEEVLKDARKNLTRDRLRHVAFWNSLMSAYAVNGLGDRVHDLLEQMKLPSRKPAENRPFGTKRSKKWSRGVPVPDAESYRIYIDLMIRKGESFDKTLDKFYEMKRRSIIPIIQIYNSLFKSLMDPVEKFPGIVRKKNPENFKKRVLLKKLYLSFKRDITQVEPNSETLYTLVSAFLDLGDTKTALEVFVFLNNYKNNTIPTVPKNIQYSSVAILAKERHTISTDDPNKMEPPKELLDRLKEIVTKRTSV
ncbi:hypothetical protein G6F56_001864 [Rhizopus delemar]|uniref:Pentacotripeptide-repeat region of PRORP domain-containing protein n=1 Tax=Rhizopus stolonifer TaxID=4846 RepID=A0A367JNQ4_RHIST|nr:hypothetical protein G6F56_001864 [Rhizopus delemar]RCH91572.1 hypothetical protein CU098_008551 [Rhizopus stolonifer]